MNENVRNIIKITSGSSTLIFSILSFFFSLSNMFTFFIFSLLFSLPSYLSFTIRLKMVKMSLNPWVNLVHYRLGLDPKRENFLHLILKFDQSLPIIRPTRVESMVDQIDSLIHLKNNLSIFCNIL